jgi:hypothetical protein
MRWIPFKDQLEACKLACLAEGHEPWSNFAKEADLIEALAELAAELALKDVPIRNTDGFFSFREEVTFDLERDFVREVVGKPATEAEFTHAPTREFVIIDEFGKRIDLRTRSVTREQRELPGNLKGTNISLSKHVSGKGEK